MTEKEMNGSKGHKAAAELPLDCRVRRVAWRIYVNGWGDKPVALAIGETRAKVKSKSLLMAREAGYALMFRDLRVLRAPEFDWAFERHGLFHWGHDHAMRMLTPARDCECRGRVPGALTRNTPGARQNNAVQEAA